ncbi:MAG: hypothetical protein C4527_16825 [Candidatus Omnitrophota bacterium]|jgi:hypothetical protein|nr:MAG: hypothetical protein C4527_16825 [Candidatus Omnitrophota bacterium]
MLNINLKLHPEIEKKLIETVTMEFNGSYELFVEAALHKQQNVLSNLIEIAEDLGIEDLAEHYDHYLYGVKK